MALPIRGTRSSSTQQNTGTSPPHQEVYTSHWTKLTHWGQTPEVRGTRYCILQKGDPKHSKLNKMKRQRNMLQMEEQGKNPQHQTNEEEISNLPKKKFRVITLKMIERRNQ